MSLTHVARCECYKGHNSSSGRCTARNITDGVEQHGGAVFCTRCNDECTPREPVRDIVNNRGFIVTPAESPYNPHGQQYHVTYLVNGNEVGNTLRTFSWYDVLGIIARWQAEGSQTC